MERFYWFWINNIHGIGNMKIRRLLEVFEAPEHIYKASKNELMSVEGITEVNASCIMDRSYSDDVFRLYTEYINKKIDFTFPFEEKYPKKLKEIYDKPFILYYKGKLPQNDRKSVAVVGSRKCSEYGRSVAGEIGRNLAKRGVDVISGLALGIDSEAHRGSVMASGDTYAVLAGGTEKCYPMQNFNLYMDILQNGGILSEYPPDTRTVPGLFPLRNRIISGLADMVIVVEAGTRSGALITVSQALEQNRTVMAVPGRIGDAYSNGCNNLIREGAGIISSYNAIFEELGLPLEDKAEDVSENLWLATEEKMLYSLFLEFAPKSLETIVKESGMESGIVLRWLLSLEIKGLIKEISQNFYVRIR